MTDSPRESEHDTAETTGVSRLARLVGVERGQVGIGTLIVFIAMVLVAAIAAGVLLNTAGFLQSQAQQTGEESSAQVTNQLQVVSKTGVVTTGTSSADDVNNLLSIDGGSNTGTVLEQADITAAESGTNGAETKLGNGDGDTITLSDGASGVTLTFTTLNQSAYEVDKNSGGSFVVNIDDGEELTTSSSGTADQVTLTFPDVGGGTTAVTIGSDGSTGTSSSETIEPKASQLTLGDGTSSIDITDGGEVTLSSQTSTVQIQDGGGDTLSVDTNANGVTLTVNVLNDDSDLSDNTFELVGPDGDSVKITEGSDKLQFDTDVVLSNGGVDVQLDSSNNFEDDGTQNLQLIDADSAGTTSSVSEINLVVLRGAGAGDIDMSGTIISFTAPDGSHTLTFNENSAQEDESFTLTAVQDEDDTEPVLSSGDRFRLTINPGTLSSGATAELRITTQSGATKVVQIRIPDSLANKEAVNL